MQNWSLKELRDQIRSNKGDRKDLIELVDAIGDGIDVFRYHLITARDSLKPFLQNEDTSDTKHFEYLLGAAEKQNEFEFAKLTNRSNIIAVIYTTRSIYDIFAQLVRGCLLEFVVSIEQCNIHIVRDKLPQGDLRNCLDGLLSSDGFKYVNDFANVSKHRSMISFGASISFVENRAGVRFKSFEYGNRKHPEMWSNDVLELVLETKNTIIEAGNALNKSTK
jgi:hypothetical protein